MMRQQMGALGGGAPGTDMQKAFEGERAALELVRCRQSAAIHPIALRCLFDLRPKPLEQGCCCHRGGVSRRLEASGLLAGIP